MTRRSGAPSDEVTEQVAVLCGDVDAWADRIGVDPNLDPGAADVVEALRAAFLTVVGWIERCPERCQEAGIWWGRPVLVDLALDLDDLVALTQPTHDPVAVLRGVRHLQRRGWLTIDSTWRVSPRLRPT